MTSTLPTTRPDVTGTLAAQQAGVELLAAMLRHALNVEAGSLAVSERHYHAQGHQSLEDYDRACRRQVHYTLEALARCEEQCTDSLELAGIWDQPVAEIDRKLMRRLEAAAALSPRVVQALTEENDSYRPPERAIATRARDAAALRKRGAWS